jgi:hypothetical protein
VEKADDLNPVADGPVEDEVFFELVDPPDSQFGETRIGRVPPFTQAGVRGAAAEYKLGCVVEPQRDFETGLRRQIGRLILQVTIGSRQ